MMTAKVFENGRSQAVRLPKECRFNTDEVAVNKIGEIVLLVPKSSNLDRSDAFTPFAPSHTVQATFIAHGVPWDKSLLLIQLLQSLVNCYKVNCFQSCFSSPFVELCNLGRCPTIE